jgi:hypothetical protein
MRHKKRFQLNRQEANGMRWNDRDFPLFQRMVVPVLMLFCVLVVGL